MDYQFEQTKPYVIDYFIGTDKTNIKSYYTESTSRKSAEMKARTLEAPARINIIKIYCLNFDDEINIAIDSIIDEHNKNNKFNCNYDSIDEEIMSI